MMFHSFNVVINDSIIETEKFEEIGQEPMPPGDVARKGLAGRSENETAVFFVFEQALGIETLHHVCHAGL